MLWSRYKDWFMIFLLKRNTFAKTNEFEWVVYKINMHINIRVKETNTEFERVNNYVWTNYDLGVIMWIA